MQFNPSPPSPLELMSLSINYSHAPLHVCLFYRPPSTESFIFDLLCSYLQSINAINFSNFVCLGDFNVNFDNESHPLFSDLFTLSSLFCLSQIVHGPTHIHHNGSVSTIDLVFVSNNISIHSCETIPPGP